MTDWSLRIAQDGWVELTLGPKPRRTVGLTPADGRALANAILRTVDLAESLADGTTIEKKEAPDGSPSSRRP